MVEKKKASRYSPEFRERAVRLLDEHRSDYPSISAACREIGGKLGCSGDSLHDWWKQARRDVGAQPGPTTAETARIKALEREVRELRQANEILKKASAYFCAGGARPPVSQMIAFIEACRTDYGVEPICRVLPIAPSTFYHQAAIARDPARASIRAQCDRDLMAHIRRIWHDNRNVYGARKVLHSLQREGRKVARCTVERLMRQMGLKGVIRGRKVITTRPDTARPCPDDRVNRQFRAEVPNQLRVSDFTYVQTRNGMVYVAFVIDVFARRIVGWKVSTSMTTQFVLDALEQAIWQRKPAGNKVLIHHSDRGSQYLSIRYTERLALADIDASVGTVGDSYDNALAETINGLYKAEVIHHLGPWKSMAQVEWETLRWVDWYNNRRLLAPIGYRPPAEAERAFYADQSRLDIAA
ncbi:IS3 family transposase [Komagataeibacter xylinus]|uniref:IS3 family transposase n=1 Tax=Komagataeibacter xylinus TaxID=28448 RepID=A0A857FPZ2_KOMXY|nr:IS3 family transposase [Komagataeibacter xylinus]QHC35569.1 IS3 family transposase [Komagataeibacter xylinus]